MMKSVATDLRPAALVGMTLVLPLVILEFLFNTTLTKHSVVGLTPLFGFLWLLPVAFVVILMPIVRNVRARDAITANLGRLSLGVALLGLITAVWVSLLVDQMPCFLGVPNCD